VTSTGSATGIIRRLRATPRWIAVLLAALTVSGPLSMDLYLPVLPALASDLFTSVSAPQLTMTACLFGLAFGQLLAGPISDRLGRRTPLITGLLIYTVASLLCAASSSIEMLVTARLVQGIAGGVGLVIAQSAGRDLYEGSRLTRYYGRIIVLSGLAATIAPVLGGLLATVLDWRGFLVLLTVVGLVVTAAVIIGFGETFDAGSRVTGGLAQTRTHLRIFGRDRLFLGATIAKLVDFGRVLRLPRRGPLHPARHLRPFVCSICARHRPERRRVRSVRFLRRPRAGTVRRPDRVRAGLALITLGELLLSASLLMTPALPVTITAFFLVAGGAAAVSPPPSTTLALADYPRHAGTAAAMLLPKVSSPIIAKVATMIVRGFIGSGADGC